MTSVLEQYLQILLAEESPGAAYIERAIHLTGAQRGHGGSSRFSQFRAVHQVLDSDSLSPPIPPDTMTDRAAFILSMVYDIGREDVARILEMKNSAVDAAAARGREAFARNHSTNVLIIENEPIVALDLQNILQSIGLGSSVAETQAEALSMAKRRRPGLLLVDINLGEGGSGLVAVREITASREIPALYSLPRKTPGV